MYAKTAPELPLPALSRVVSSSRSTADGNIAFLSDPALRESCGTVIAFTERGGGSSEEPYRSLNLASHVADDPCAVRRNRHDILSALGIADFEGALVNPRQVHGAEVDVLTERNRASFAPREQGSDAVACTARGVPVLLCYADCVPIVIVAPGGAFCVIHAGWRGALADIPARGVNVLMETVASAADGHPDTSGNRICEGLAARCNAYIGPHIGPCCFETGAEVIEPFVARFGREVISENGNLDLGRAVRASLVSAGIDGARICDAGVCTVCAHERFFSYRAEDGVTGRIGAIACRLDGETS